MEGEINAKSIVELSSTVELGDGGVTYIYIFFMSNFSPAALIYLHFIFIPFWQILTFLQIQLLLSSYFSSDSLCALSLSLSLLSCLLALQHTLVASLSLFLSPTVFISLFFLVYLFQSYCLSQSPSLKCLCFECCAHASIKLKDASHSFHYTCSV